MTNREDKVLIIDDEPAEYRKIKKWLEDECHYQVVPAEEEFSKMHKARTSKKALFDLVDELIKKNYIDLKLILCDINFDKDNDLGNAIVQHIREFMGLNPHYWTSLVPIIGMTNYADSQNTRANNLKPKKTIPKTNKRGIVDAGADYAFNKAILQNTTKRNELKGKLKFYVNIFERNIDRIYPPHYKDKIISAKNEHKNDTTAFIISSFRHEGFITRVENVLREYNITPLIANIPGGRYSRPLWEDIVIHTHVCDFGIAIYADDSKFNERDNKERDKMNPNVNIEVGYMLSLQQNVLFLKHDSIHQLPSDFSGEQYAPFSDEASLENRLKEWLGARGFKKKSDTTS